MKKYLIGLILIVSTGGSYAQDSGRPVLIAGNKLSIMIPVSFDLPVCKAPGIDSLNICRFKNKNEEVWFLFELATGNNAIEITDDDIPQWADKQLKALEKSSSYKYIDDGIFLQDGKNISYVKYESSGYPKQRRFSMMFFISVDGRLVQFQFSCPMKQRKKWESIADAIANSLRLVQ